MISGGIELQKIKTKRFISICLSIALVTYSIAGQTALTSISVESINSHSAESGHIAHGHDHGIPSQHNHGLDAKFDQVATSNHGHEAHANPDHSSITQAHNADDLSLEDSHSYPCCRTGCASISSCAYFCMSNILPSYPNRLGLKVDMKSLPTLPLRSVLVQSQSEPIYHPPK